MTERYCRVCFKLFCCNQCRMKHERVKHNLEVCENCDICKRGRMRFSITKKFSQNLLTHIQDQHIKLRCRKCKTIFNSVSEVIESLRCESRSENYLNEISVVISGNTINQIATHDGSESNGQRPKMKCTSTPMSSANNDQGCKMEVVSPTEFELSHRESPNHTPTDVTPIYSINHTNMPVITPLRSIISKNKSNNTDRRVTFSDMISSQESKSSKKPSRLDLNTPELKRDSLSNIVALNLSPITPICNKSVSELFYTPEAPSSTTFKHNEARQTNGGEERNIGFMGIFGNISKAITTVFRSMFKPEQVEPQLFYMNTSGSIKRFLSPNADRSVPKLKRLCVRGRQPINRTNYIHNENSD